ASSGACGSFRWATWDTSRASFPGSSVPCCSRRAWAISPIALPSFWFQASGLTFRSIPDGGNYCCRCGCSFAASASHSPLWRADRRSSPSQRFHDKVSKLRPLDSVLGRRFVAEKGDGAQEHQGENRSRDDDTPP